MKQVLLTNEAGFIVCLFIAVAFVTCVLMHPFPWVVWTVERCSGVGGRQPYNVPGQLDRWQWWSQDSQCHTFIDSCMKWEALSHSILCSYELLTPERTKKREKKGLGSASASSDSHQAFCCSLHLASEYQGAAMMCMLSFFLFFDACIIQIHL